jgi:hypothetical protein
MLIQNYDKSSKWNIKFDKIYIFKKIHIYWKMINTKKKKSDLLRWVYIFLITSYKKISFQKKIIWKSGKD